MTKLEIISILFCILSMNLAKTVSNESSELFKSVEKMEFKSVTESPSTSVKLGNSADKYVNIIMSSINDYLPKGIAPFVEGLITAVPKTYLKKIAEFLKTVASFNLADIINKGKKALKMLDLMI